MQEKVCTLLVDIFPMVDKFKGMKDLDQLISIQTVSRFLTWLLLEVKESEFIKQEWNIRDEVHHKYWLGECKFPVNDKK